MSKQFINEVNRMKDLFGYKKGQVISEQLTTKQKEAVNAGYPRAISDEEARKLPLGPDGKIAPKKVDTPTNDGFDTYPCVKNLGVIKTENRDGKTMKFVQAVGNNTDVNIGGLNYTLSSIKFFENGDAVIGNIIKKFSCGSGREIIIDNVKIIPKPTTQTLPNVTVRAIPRELKNAEGVKKFQDWLDENVDGWLLKPGVKLKKGKGYGNFGPKTKAAWDKNKYKYLESLVQIKNTQPFDDEKMDKYASQIPNSGGLGVPTDDGELYADNYE
jgi:hypothetical protein